MTIHTEAYEQDQNTSSDKSQGSNSQGGASSYKSKTVSEVRNLSFDKLYEAIKMISRSLCETRNKYMDLNLVNMDLKQQLSCLKVELEDLSVENT